MSRAQGLIARLDEKASLDTHVLRYAAGRAEKHLGKKQAKQAKVAAKQAKYKSAGRTVKSAKLGVKVAKRGVDVGKAQVAATGMRKAAGISQKYDLEKARHKQTKKKLGKEVRGAAWKAVKGSM